ncbi:transposase-like zinc-binding domain-containing protein [Neosynechococcus sphagnicola]|uniref:IS1/IS1595 family N-terminal zinc-binding domain-containing protein n=1 Tax=Neosynechococcus sphagnicola TaxID=1501145 RepID=UPI003B8321DE
MPVCPSGASSHTVKNGHIHNGKQRFKCHDCGRQFIEQRRPASRSPYLLSLITRPLRLPVYEWLKSW